MTDCIYCNKTFNYPSKWIRHCATKKHIKNVEKATQSKPKVSQSKPKVTQSKPKVSQKLAKVTILPKTETESFYGYCKYCEKGFKHKQSLSKHQKHVCKERPQATTIINNTTNNTTNQTIVHNHVHINVYGQEDFSKLMSPEFFEQLKELTGLQRQDKMITHMYTAAPNNTARIPNMNQPYCITMGEEGEMKQSLKPVVQNILEQLPENTEQMFINYIKALPGHFIKKKALVVYNEILKELNEHISNPKKKKEIEKIIKAALYNN